MARVSVWGKELGEVPTEGKKFFSNGILGGSPCTNHTQRPQPSLTIDDVYKAMRGAEELMRGVPKRIYADAEGMETLRGLCKTTGVFEAPESVTAQLFGMPVFPPRENFQEMLEEVQRGDAILLWRGTAYMRKEKDTL